MKTYFLTLVTLLLISPSWAMDYANSDLQHLSWLSGYWQNSLESVTTEECWLSSSPDDMIGMHRSTRSNGNTFLEYLKIENTPQGIVYVAYPAGQEKTIFKLDQLTGNKVTFTNPSHDFPQTITYWLDSENILHAQIKGHYKGKLMTKEWMFSKKTLY